MKKNSKAIAVVVLAIFAAVAIWATISLTKSNQEPPVEVSDYTATEIQLSDVPAAIRTEMEANLNSGGAYFYRQETGTDVYALLTFGSVLGLDMSVAPTQVEEGVYFSVSALETDSTNEATVYKVYVTDAPAVAADTTILSNPYLKPNTVGTNAGVLTGEGDSYYIMPLLDTGTVCRVYSASESLSPLDDGIYDFTYTLTPDGAKLLTAECQERYQCVGLITEVVGGPTPRIKVQIGQEKLMFELKISQDMLATFEGLGTDFKAMRCKLEFTYENGLNLDSYSVLSYVS